LPTSRHTELLKYGVYLKRIQDFDRALLMLSTAKERNSLSPDSFEEMAIPNNSKREENYLTAVQLDTVFYSLNYLSFSSFFLFYEECRLVNSRRALAAMCADNNKFDEALNVLSEGLKKREKCIKITFIDSLFLILFFNH
jgi:hypothetical protein